MVNKYLLIIYSISSTGLNDMQFNRILFLETVTNVYGKVPLIEETRNNSYFLNNYEDCLFPLIFEIFLLINTGTPDICNFLRMDIYI